MTRSRKLVRIISRLFLLLLLLLVLLAAWIAFDLRRAHATDIRSFDPDEVARLETQMWRSYYARRRARLFLQLGELLREQYRFPYWQSQRVAYHAARAAFVFKDGHSRADYERAARLELEWWIVHRERRQHQPGDLARALADSAAEIYQVPAARLAEHARLRAEAMTIRDSTAAAGGVSEADWARIDQLLHQSWRSLHQA